jgi:hypothetical protein
VVDAPAAPPRISMAEHARITALIAEGDRPLKDVLAAEGVPENEWNDATMHWMNAMAADAAEKGAGAVLAIDYADVFGKAQDAIKPVPPMTPEEWGALTVEVLDAGGPARPLAARNLSKADYLRLARHWAKRLAGDPGENKRFFAVFAALTAKPT